MVGTYSSGVNLKLAAPSDSSSDVKVDPPPNESLLGNPDIFKGAFGRQYCNPVYWQGGWSQGPIKDL